MKTWILLLFISISSLISAQDLDKRFSVGVFGSFPVGGYEENVRFNKMHSTSTAYTYIRKYWEIGIEGGYTLPIYKRLIFQPIIAFDYSRHDGIASIYDGPVPPRQKLYAEEFNLTACIPIGIAIPINKSRLDIGTGPLFGCYLYQKNVDKISDKNTIIHRNFTNRFAFYWRWYAKYNFIHDRFYTKLTYDIGASHYSNSAGLVKSARLRNQMSLGIGVNL